MALTLPYPSMNFVPLDILTAQQQNQLVANIQYIANQFPISDSNIEAGGVLKRGNQNLTRASNLNNIGTIFNSSYKDGYYTFNSWSGSPTGSGQPSDRMTGTLISTSSSAWNICTQFIIASTAIYNRRYSDSVWGNWSKYEYAVASSYPTVESAKIATTGYQRIDKQGRLVCLSVNFSLSQSAPTGEVLLSGCPLPTTRTVFAIVNGADSKGYRAYVTPEGKVVADGAIGSGWNQGQCVYFEAV